MCHFCTFDATTAAAICLYSEKTEQQTLLLPFSSLRKPATSPSLCWDQGRPSSLLALCQNDAGRGELPMPEENWRGGETNMVEGNVRRKDQLKCWKRSKVTASVNNAGKLNSNSDNSLTFCRLHALIYSTCRKTNIRKAVNSLLRQTFKDITSSYPSS